MSEGESNPNLEENPNPEFQSPIPENTENKDENENPNPEENQNTGENPNPEDPNENKGETEIETETEPPKKEYAPANPTLNECIQLNQLLPLNKIDKNIEAISTVIYENDDLLNEFLQKIDNRTKICTDDPEGEFITCEQNRDGDSYRSPFSNKYFPPTDDAKYPSPPLRKLEESFNQIFKNYAKAYYSTSSNISVYCWDLGDNPSDGFGVAVLIKHSVNGESMHNGLWDSSNVISVNFSDNGKKAKYNLITTVNLTMAFSNKTCGNVSLSGSLTRSSSAEKNVKDYYSIEHLENIGKMVEDLESNISNTLDAIYVSKSKEIIDTSRVNPILGKPGIAQAMALKNVVLGMKK